MGVFSSGDIGRYLDSSDCLTIPVQFTTMANCTCRSNQDIRSVTILGIVTRIGGEAFSYCSTLGYVNLPSSLEAMGDCTFSSCKLKNLAIPENRKVIPFNAFSHCSLLNQISLDNGVQTISLQTFADCRRPLKIYVSSSVTYIAGEAFEFIRNSPSNSKLIEICA